MNKTLATLALVLLLSAGSCTPTPAEQPDPLVLPYPLYEQEFHGSQVTVTLQTSLASQVPYEFLMTARAVEGQTRFGVYVITVVLTEGYQQGMSVDWTERIGDNTGSGGTWEGESLGAQDLVSAAGYIPHEYGPYGAVDYPAAVFVRVVANDPNDPNITYEQTYGPVAVLQILPDGQGVVRLDQ